MSERLRIVVGGLAVAYPYGGVFWDYLQYPLGLHELGHDVLYLEDSGHWCYDPRVRTFVAGGAANAAAFAERVRRLVPELAGRWSFRDPEGTVYGRSSAEVAAFCGDADLLLDLSASLLAREEYRAARRSALVDSDPMYTQASFPDYVAGTADRDARERVERILRHDVFFTFGENAGWPRCGIPASLVTWIPTRQPVVLRLWRCAAQPVSSRRRVLTTVGSWVSSPDSLVVNSVTYGGKGSELERFRALPARSPVPLELALSGDLPAASLRRAGFRLADADAVSGDPDAYRAYIAGSLGEWSVAKPAYVAGRTGWFSCRTACYLAAGVPAVVQDTGFTERLPAGEGLLAFRTVEEAAAAIEAVAAAPERHARAAIELATEHLDARRVLPELLEAAL